MASLCPLKAASNRWSAVFSNCVTWFHCRKCDECLRRTSSILYNKTFIVRSLANYTHLHVEYTIIDMKGTALYYWWVGVVYTLTEASMSTLSFILARPNLVIPRTSPCVGEKYST